MNARTAVRELCGAANRLHDRKLYARLEDTDWLLISAPDELDPMAAQIMGGGGITFGLNLLRGEAAASRQQRLLDGFDRDNAPRLMLAGGGMLSYELCGVRELSEPGRAWLEKRGGLHPNRKNLYPDPMARTPGTPVRPPSADETRLLLHVVNGLLAAIDDDRLDPRGIEPDGHVQHLLVDGPLKKPSISFTRTMVPGVVPYSTRPPAAGSDGSDGPDPA